MAHSEMGWIQSIPERPLMEKDLPMSFPMQTSEVIITEDKTIDEIRQKLTEPEIN